MTGTPCTTANTTLTTSQLGTTRCAPHRLLFAILGQWFAAGAGNSSSPAPIWNAGIDQVRVDISRGRLECIPRVAPDLAPVPDRRDQADYTASPAARRRPPRTLPPGRWHKAGDAACCRGTRPVRAPSWVAKIILDRARSASPRSRRSFHMLCETARLIGVDPHACLPHAGDAALARTSAVTLPGRPSADRVISDHSLLPLKHLGRATARIYSHPAADGLADLPTTQRYKRPDRASDRARRRSTTRLGSVMRGPRGIGTREPYRSTGRQSGLDPLENLRGFLSGHSSDRDWNYLRAGNLVERATGIEPV